MSISSIFYRVVLILSLCLPSLVAINSVGVSASNMEIPIYGERNYFQDEPKQVEPTIGEVAELRTEYSKTSYLGDGKYSLDSSTGVIHYKDDYSNINEQWKDIDLTMVNGVVDKAPYILRIDGLLVSVTDKKTGSTANITLTDIGDKGNTKIKNIKPIFDLSDKEKLKIKDIDVDTDLEISWSNTQISYTRILKSDKASTLAKFDISQTGTGIAVRTKAVDSKTDVDKSVPVISEIKDGILTESIDTSTHILTYPVRIDPTLDIIVNLGTDDCYTDTTTMYTTRTYINIGYAAYAGWRFRSVSIASGSTITDAWLDMYSASAQTADTVRTKVSGEQSATSATFSTYADYGGRTLTTAQIDWDFTTDWAGNAAVDSTNIKTIIQELVDDYSGLSSANISILIKDDSSSSGALRQIWTYEGYSPYAASLHIVYSAASLAVTTNSASSIESTTTTLNGNITTKGSTNVTHRGFAWGTTSNTTKPALNQAPPATYTSSNITSGSYAVGSFTDARTGLSAGTSYYYRAAANDSAGWAWGDQVTFLTKPAAPTSVAATENNNTAVVVTWTKSTGATGYMVFRGATEVSGWLGDVATYSDTGAAAPFITPGTGAATDGSSTSKVSLSISGNSIADGTSYDYKVRAKNATGNSSDSSTDAGFRLKGSLTYQWNVSAADSDGSFGTIAGGTTASYDYTGAPAPTITGGTTTATDGIGTSNVTLSIAGESANNGAGRYYYCTLSATGSASQNTTHDRGYMGVGALGYQWYRSASTSDASYSTIAGATTDPYIDTAAPEPTITAGTASASDGTSTAHVVLADTGEAGVNGAVRYYKANLTATGAATANSTANDGYRGTTTLTYVWQRSAADSDASYSNITGGTTDPYNDTGAPVNGDGRYFKVIVSMTGASSNTTLADRGYRLVTYDITNTPASKAFGAVKENTVYYAKGTAPNNPVVNGDCTFSISNNGTVPIDLSVHSHDFTGGVGWTLVSDYPSTMADPFTDNSFDTNNFIESTNAGSLVVEQNNRLELTSAASVSGFIRSNSTYQLAETQTIIKVSQQSTDGGFKFCPTLVVDHMWDVYSEANWYNFQMIAGGAIRAAKNKSGSGSTLATSGALTPPYWLRMRVTGGTIYFEYADNRTTKPNEYGWTELTHETWDLGVPLTTAEYIYMSSYNTPTTGSTYVTDFEHGTITSLGDAKAKMTAYYSGQSLKDAVVLTTSNQAFISNLLATNTTMWDFKMLTGGFTDGVQKATIITFTSTVH